MPDFIAIKINGTPVQDIELDLIELTVDTNLFLPAMFTLRLIDELDLNSGKLKYADVDRPFKLGAEVQIDYETDDIPGESRPVKTTLFKGEITAIEPSFSEEGMPYFQIRGYDQAHRLTHGKKTRTYGDGNPQGSGITDKQIIQTIIGEVSLRSGKIDTPAGVKYPYVLQYNQTDMEFLWSRARALGLQVYVDDKSLHMVPFGEHRGKQSDVPSKLTWNENLASFQPRITLMNQATAAEVRGWDPDKKQAIVSKISTASPDPVPKIGLNKKGSALIKSALKVKAAEQIVVDHPVVTMDQAKALASSQFTEAESEFLQAEGTCRFGDPRLVAGRWVEIEGVGERFKGKYYITEARHVWNQGRYHVDFAVTGYAPNTLSHLLGSDHKERDNGRIYGVVTAKVTSLEDPQNLGRVKLMYPWLPQYKNADLSSSWARLANPMGGGTRGFFFTPEVDDEVLVAFEQGDVNFPYIIGTLWNNTDKPPTGTGEILSSDKKKVDQRIIRSRSGHLIVLNDKDGEESIVIQDKSEKNSIVIDTKTKAMTIKAEGDITIESGGKFILKSKGDMSFESKAKGLLKTMSDFTVEATGKAGLKGTAGLDLVTTAKAGLKGAMVEVSGDAKVSVGGNAMTEIKSGGIVQVQGPLIKLN